MKLEQYVKSLLYQQECVTIPDFGAFLARISEAKIDENESFKAPEKEIVFNEKLLANDGVLANFVAEKQGISYESALRKIEKQVRIWKKKLKTQPLEFSGIGKITTNESKEWVFLPTENNDFNLNSYGLGNFKRPPVEESLEDYEETIKNISNMEQHFNSDFSENYDDSFQNEPLMFTPENDDSDSRSPAIRYLLIGIIAIAVVGTAYYFGDLYVQNQKSKEQTIAQDKIRENVQRTTFDLGTFSETVVTMDALQQNDSPSFGASPLRSSSLLNNGNREDYYSIIAGSFRSLRNAEKKVKELKRYGYKASLVDTNPVEFHRVAYGRFTNKKEAINLLYFIRFGLEEDAWFLEEKLYNDRPLLN